MPARWYTIRYHSAAVAEEEERGTVRVAGIPEYLSSQPGKVSRRKLKGCGLLLAAITFVCAAMPERLLAQTASRSGTGTWYGGQVGARAETLNQHQHGTGSASYHRHCCARRACIPVQP